VINLRYIFFGFCIFANIFLAVFGIIIDDINLVILAIISFLLILFPTIQGYYAKEKKQENKTDDKGSSS